MPNIRSTNDIILELIDLLRLSRPDCDSKPGSVIRDIIIDPPSSMMGLLYDEIAKSSDQQSIRLVVGSDLDKLAKNYGISRTSASASSGIGILTFNNLQGIINVNSGELITASNGFSYTILNGVSINPSQANFYRSVATKYRNDLDFVGIQDQFAVEITLQATTVGISGNIAKYSLVRTAIPGISNVTNTAPFTGGSNQEDDATFRNRILAAFSGSSVGTVLGYKNTALTTTGVSDAFIVEPGNPLMERDGSVIETDSEGNKTVIEEGSGGKVDIVILGNNLVENIDSYIYRDLSNKNDPTDSKNIVVLGQISGDENKTINRKRIDNLANEVLPSQPVDSILQVTGSSSGTNFLPKSIDMYGRVSGNYELIKDTGIYSGSPFGFDSFHFIDNKISDFQEDRIKGKFNGQDTSTFSDVLEISKVQQNISIINENSASLSYDRSLIQLKHTPATSITRVFNVNTGERYTVVNQNVNGSNTINTSGIIKITGNTLPSPSDVLQVDYIWIFNFDQYSDFDGRKFTNNKRSVVDSIDWGYSNLIKSENIKLVLDSSSNFFSGSTLQPISSIIQINTFLKIDGVVSLVTSGVFAGRLSVTLNNLLEETQSINHIYFKSTFIELFNTAQNNGSFSNSAIVVGIHLEYNTTIILPTDTKAVAGDNVTVTINNYDIYNNIESPGSFNNNLITVPVSNFDTIAEEINVEVIYIANLQNIITTSINSLPASRAGNGFKILNGNGFNNTNIANLQRREFQIVQQNLSNEFYVELSLSSLESSLAVEQILSVIRIVDNFELWNKDDNGSIDINLTNNNYQLIFDGYSLPNIGDRVLIIYQASNNLSYQPFTYQNDVYYKNFDFIQYNSVDDTFITNLHNFTSETNLEFQIIEPDTNIILYTYNDGYLSNNGNTASFGSSINFNNILNNDSIAVNILSKKIRILNSNNVNNNNIFDIISYAEPTNLLTITNDFGKINNNQISIIRLIDGQEIWNSTLGEINIDNNQLIFPASSAASVLDKVLVLVYNFTNLKQCPTRLSVNISDQINNSGVISINGTTITKAEDIVFTATNSGLRQNLLEAFRKFTGLNSNTSIPSNIKLAKLIKLENVSTPTITSNEVLTINSTYDIFNTTIKDNVYYINEMISDQSLGVMDCIIPSTENNTLNIPKIGDRLRATFYYSTDYDLENISFTKNGTLYSNKSYALINKIYISSGFNSSQSARLTINTINQPITGSRYKSYYDYLAPKPNERIIIKYNNNKLILDATLNIENSRPINADVLVREAKSILIDISMNIVISVQSLTSKSLIIQNVKDALISAINATSLGTTLDSSSLIDTAFSVAGVAGARIIFFNKNGAKGQIIKIKAQNDEFLTANSVIVEEE